MVLILEGNLKNLNYTGELPCRGLERYQSHFTDMDIKENESDTAGVLFEITFKEWSYKEVKSVRSMNMQSLICIKISTIYLITIY